MDDMETIYHMLVEARDELIANRQERILEAQNATVAKDVLEMLIEEGDMLVDEMQKRIDRLQPLIDTKK